MKHLSKKQKKSLVKIILGVVLFAAAFAVYEFVDLPKWVQIMIFICAYVPVAFDTIVKAAKNFSHGQIFDENFLMVIASIGAFAIGEYPEAVFVMLFYRVGELFESIAVGKSRRSVSELMNIRADHANIKCDGKLVEVAPEEVDIGDIIIVKPGERIPLDGIVVSGCSELNTMALTGESMPREVGEGDAVISGCINIRGLLHVKVTHTFADSTVSRILELVQNSAANKAKTENFITKFARYYTPAVVGIAVLLAAIPPIFVGNFADWLYRALNFLVVSCPCALVISVPLSYFGGIAGASKNGILVKGGNYFDVLSELKTVVFDKTGTLTSGTFKVTAVNAKTIDNDKLLELAAYAENYSDHPIAMSIKTAYGRSVDTHRLGNIIDIPGKGLCAEIDGKKFYVGNSKLMDDVGIIHTISANIGTNIYVASETEYFGCITISDEPKPTSASAISELYSQGINNIVMLTGDSKNVAEKVSRRLGINNIRYELMPQDKVDCITEIIKENSGKVAFVGDGINDAPVLARSDVGIAMGSMGSDAAIEAADVVIMDDDPMKIPAAIRLAKRTRRIVIENIVFALSVKGLILVLCALGLAGMWLAAFADVGVSVIAILNAMRTLHKINRST